MSRKLIKKTNDIVGLNQLIKKLAFHILPTFGLGTGVFEITLTIVYDFLLLPAVDLLRRLSALHKTPIKVALLHLLGALLAKD